MARILSTSLAHPDQPDFVVEEMFRRNQKPLGRFLVQMTKDRSLSEELLQDAFVTVVANRDDLPSTYEEQRRWLFTIARNRALHALRGRRRAQELLHRLRPDADGHADAESPTALRDLLVRVLSPSDRSILLLRHVHGFTAEEIALMTDLSAASIRQRLSRARRRLEPHLATSRVSSSPEPLKGRS